MRARRAFGTTWAKASGLWLAAVTCAALVAGWGPAAATTAVELPDALTTSTTAPPLLTVSPVTLPPVSVPGLELPPVTVLPEVTVPTVTLPPVTVPLLTAPGTTAPAPQSLQPAAPATTAVVRDVAPAAGAGEQPGPVVGTSSAASTTEDDPARPAGDGAGGPAADQRPTGPLPLRLREAASETARQLSFPLGLAAAILAFLVLQPRLDRGDPSVSHAGISRDDDLLGFS
ncbi:MAG TPA: hypothetical protein VHM89_08440 [Acidimicrobiales bacterium]|nr:hypothetical protein [Acidimicrobiales bacterium]